MTNQQRDAHDNTASSKDKRKVRKELEEARREYTEKMAMLEAEEEEMSGKASVSNMVIPDYRSGRNEKDIHVRNVSLSLDNGTPLLDYGELEICTSEEVWSGWKEWGWEDDFVEGDCRF